MHVGISSGQNSKTSFGSLRPQKRLCEEVLKEFKQEFPYLKSSSKIGSQMYRHWDDPKYQGVISRVYKKFEKMQERIYDYQYNRFFSRCYDSYNHFLEALKSTMKSKGMANCWEDSVLIHDALNKKGLKPENIEMVVETNIGGGNHFVSVVGLKKGANIRNPKTWGSKAMMVDGWQGFVMKATDGIEYLKKELAKNQPVIKVYFKSADPKMSVNYLPPSK